MIGQIIFIDNTLYCNKTNKKFFFQFIEFTNY